MKNIKKVVFGILILTILITPFFAFLNVKAEEADYEPQRGDLRCPQIKDAKVSCVEHKNGNGVVTSVDLVYGSLNKKGDIQITKTVTRLFAPDKEGHYKVSFTVKGKDVPQIKTVSDAYVLLMYDTSATMGDETAARNAIWDFGNKLLSLNNTGMNYNLAFLQFANSVQNVQGFSKKNVGSICGLNKCSLGKQSKLEKAYSKAYSMFTDRKINADDAKILVLFGDGRYHIGKCGLYYANGTPSSKNDTDWCETTKQRDKLRKINVKLYGARYEADYGSEYFGHDKDYMKAATDKYYFAAKGNQYKSMFQSVLNDIQKQIEEESSSYSSDLTDNLGVDFYLTGDTGTWKNFGVGKITEKGWSTPNGGFEIEIDKFAKEGWHETNNSFNLTYTDEDGVEQIIDVQNNPEVYWVPDKTNVAVCSGRATVSGIRKDDGDSMGFYTRSCIEGYNGNPLQVEMYVKDIPEKSLSTAAKNYIKILPNDAKKTVDANGKFTIASGLGISSYLKLKTSVRCSYKFNYDEFNNRYQKLKRGVNLAVSSDPEKEDDNKKERLSAYKKITGALTTNLQQATNAVSTNDMITYGDRFINQNATMVVTYNNSKTAPDNINLVNIPGTIVQPKNPSCSYGSYKNLTVEVPALNMTDSKGNKVSLPSVKKSFSIPLSKDCTISYSKEMTLENSCLNMKTGEQETCIPDSNKQINGGSKFYTKMKETGGVITIDMPGMGITGKVDVSLKADQAKNEKSCTFESSKKLTDIKYRQIELADPFLVNKYDKSRGIGENYKNSKYDFVDIIKADTWDNNSEYSYALSKTNINSIRKDTAEEGVNSYTGRNCYFNASNKYVCDFTRNKNQTGDGSSANWFTNSTIPD